MALSLPDSEVDVWNALRRGDEEALTDLIGRYSRPLMYYGRKMVPNDDLIQDAIQEVFIQIWTYRATLRADVSEVKAYLFASLRRRLVQERKNPGYLLNPVSDSHYDSPFDVEFSIEDKLIESETEARRVALINQYLNALPKRQKEALYLKFYGDLTNQQIADVMAIRYQTATNLIHEALTSLRQALSQQALTLLLILIVGGLE